MTKTNLDLTKHITICLIRNITVTPWYYKPSKYIENTHLKYQGKVNRGDQIKVSFFINGSHFLDTAGILTCKKLNSLFLRKLYN